HESTADFEAFFAVHVYRMLIVLNGFRPGRLQRSARRHIERLNVRAIRTELRAENSSVSIFGRSQHHRTRTVAEQNTSRAVLPVQQATERVGTDNQGVANLSGPNK